MPNSTRLTITARHIRSVAVITMLLIAADGFASEGASARRAPCGGQLLHCMGCVNQGNECSYYSGGQWCYGVTACIDCQYNPLVEGEMCLAM